MSWTMAGDAAVPGTIVSPWSDLSVGTSLATLNLGTPASTAWPLANLAIYVPFQLVRPWTARVAFAYCGATSGGNFDVGIYDEAGTKLVSSGAKARAASAYVFSNITDTYLGPGTYYMALAVSTTNTIFSVVPAVPIAAALGVCEQATAYTLPATATMALSTRTVIPVFGFTDLASPNI